MTNHSVCVVTGSRAEFGLLRRLIDRLYAAPAMDMRLVVTGSHLDPAFGGTQNEVEASGLPIHAKLPIPLGRDTKTAMVQATAQAMSRFADYFTENRPELLVVLGDRYEIFAAVSAAALLGIPIAHIHGGETTEGAVDEFLRHAITKMSYLHFTSCEEYRRRVIQLGESPERVFSVGALGVENAVKLPPMPLAELQESIGFPLEGKPFSIVTFHSVTLEDDTAECQMGELIRAIDDFPDMNFVITKANADAGGREINRIWDDEAKKRSNWIVVPSLGARRYLSALKYAQMILGNSSSGILEAPALHIPTVNIGDRQKGRMMADSVICCDPKADEIQAAMRYAVSPEGKTRAAHALCPFGNGKTSERIANIILSFLDTSEKNMKKSFYDVSFEGS